MHRVPARRRRALARAEYVTVTDAWIFCVPASIGGAALGAASAASAYTTGVAWPPSRTFSAGPSVRPAALAIACAFCFASLSALSNALL